MSAAHYQIFPRQSDALDFSMQHGVLPVFAIDNPKSKTESAKMYIAASYEAFWEHYIYTQPRERWFYEVMIQDVPCHLHVDAEITLGEKNPSMNSDAVATIDSDFRKYCLDMFVRMGYCQNKDQVDVRVLDASNDRKSSKHFIFVMKDGSRFQNNYHCGAFMRRLRNYIQEREEIDAKKNRFFFWTYRKRKEEESDLLKALVFYGDMGIYTMHRVYRLVGSSKGGKPMRPFYPEGCDKSKWVVSKEELFHYYVQGPFPDNQYATGILKCMNPDNSEPHSASDMKPYRPDLNVVRLLRSPANAPVECIIDRRLIHYHYQKDFPFEEIFKWLGADPNREFSFSGDGKYRRYLKFSSAANMRTEVIQTSPLKIHVGAIYKDLSLGAKSEVTKRELTFDIDLNDYKDDQGRSIRACCGEEKKTCLRCWKYAQFAIRVLNDILTKDFGYERILFVFSGRRGLHCWVSDESA